MSVDGKIWEQRLRELLEFREARGHLRVPRGWPENPRLATWVMNQRRLLRHGELEPARARRLAESGIAWTGAAERRDARAALWEEFFGAAKEFRRRHGHLNVPRRNPEARALSAWIAMQRFMRKNGRLSEERFRKLEALGFEWERPGTGVIRHSTRKSRSRAWEERFDAFAAGGRSSSLSRWARYQRLLRRRGLLTRERRERLEALGFDWSSDTNVVRIREHILSRIPLRT